MESHLPSFDAKHLETENDSSLRTDQRMYSELRFGGLGLFDTSDPNLPREVSFTALQRKDRSGEVIDDNYISVVKFLQYIL